MNVRLHDDGDFGAAGGLDVVAELGRDPEVVETGGGAGDREHAVRKREHARPAQRVVGVRHTVDFASRRRDATRVRISIKNDLFLKVETGLVHISGTEGTSREILTEPARGRLPIAKNV